MGVTLKIYHLLKSYRVCRKQFCTIYSCQHALIKLMRCLVFILYILCIQGILKESQLYHFENNIQ